MAIVLPRDKRFLIGFRFPELIPFELNWVDVSLLLPAVFRRAVLDGNDSERNPKVDIENIQSSVDRFIEHPRLQGFSSAEGRKVADRVVQGALTRQVRKARTRERVIHGIIPYSLASFKVGFPTNTADLRQVDRYIYSLLFEQFDGNERRTSEFIERVFGEGIKVVGGAAPSATRLSGEQERLDVLTELSLCYIDGFDAVTPKPNRAVRPYVFSAPMPGFQRKFGSDLYRYWETYASRVPKTMLIDQTVILISLELLVLTLKLFHAIPALVENPDQLPPAMTDRNESTPPELFVDWTADPRHFSRAMSMSCVRRDIGKIEDFGRAVFGLRYLGELIKSLPRERELQKAIDDVLGDAPAAHTPSFAQGLLHLLNHPLLRFPLHYGANRNLDDIRAVNGSNGENEEPSTLLSSEAVQLIEQLNELERSPVEQVQELLFRAQYKKTQDNILGWISDVAGVAAPHGFISGNAKNRRSWAYSPGNEVLAVLVQLCAIDYVGWNPKGGTAPTGFGLAEFLDWLERRFGIIVDRPPADLGFDGAEHIAAARDNLQAMLRRLRQMGMFMNQSDDFTVQQIAPPFAE